MNTPLPTLLVPGLTLTSRLYEAQIPALWQFGPVIIADHRRDDSIAAIARRVLEHAPCPTPRRRASRSLACRWAATLR
jgi:hypothetical protein